MLDECVRHIETEVRPAVASEEAAASVRGELARRAGDQ
jgi:hypothetical protein